MFKKIISLCLVLCMLVSSAVLHTAYAKGETVELQCNADGKFKIAVISDTHLNGDLNDVTMKIIEEALDFASPDLVIFLGDNEIADALEMHEYQFDILTKPVRDRNIPFAAVFGNHDDQDEATEKEELFSMYNRFGSIAYDAEPEIYGTGNCNLPIYSSDGERLMFNLFLFDSGSDNPDETTGGYDYIREDQIEWYKNTALSLKEQNGGQVVPSLVFQHIPVAEIYDKLYIESLFNLGVLTLPYNGSNYTYLPKFNNYQGLLFEHIGSPYGKTEELDVMREVGDVMAGFSGHDHVNSYETELDGIDWISVPTPHNKNYSNNANRGVGLITLDENLPGEYDYELIRACDLAVRDGSEICQVEGSTNKATYSIVRFFAHLIEDAQNIVKAVREILRIK